MQNIGILGLGKIARRVAEGIVYASNANLYAVASRSIEKATAFANDLEVVCYGSYEEMLQDPMVDVVYICTPNHLHFEHIRLCLAYEKHVICEKPFVSDVEQLHSIFAYAKEMNCFLMEAEKTLFTPLNQLLYTIIQAGKIGKLQYIEASYGYLFDKSFIPYDYWGYRATDGGCMYDVGVYPICYANYFAQAQLQDITCMKQVAKEGYDEMVQALLQYKNGVIASVRSSWNMTMDNKGYLYGDKGYLVCESFWKSTKAKLIIDGNVEQIEVEQKSDFTGEIEHAVYCIEQGLLESPILGEAQSLEIMKVLEAVKHKDQTKIH